jgi:RimJ/RimL family protein N-acetyltransferase
MRLQEIRDISDTAQIFKWFTRDAEGNRRLGFYADPDQWFKLLSPSRRAWLVIAEDQPVGFLDVEIDGPTGYLAYYVAPEHRGKGFGALTLRLAVDQARQLGLTALDGGVEPDNLASIAALKRAGFHLFPEDAEGMLPTRLEIPLR